MEGCIEALVELGFTNLEAEIYAFLVQESPATGYRVAQALGKPVANTYKAIESLQNKGAILVDESSTRLYRAVPPDEVLTRMERVFAERRVRAAKELSRLGSAPADDRVYRLTAKAQLLERCRAMIARSRSVILIDVFPLMLEELRTDLEEAAHRGVNVLVKAYVPTEVAGARVLLNPRGEDVMRRYPGQWVVHVADGGELLIGTLTADARDVVHAIWTGSAFLSWIVHASVGAEFLLTEIITKLEEGVSGDDLKAVLSRVTHREPQPTDRDVPVELRIGIDAILRSFHPTVPGYQMMLEQLGEVAQSPNGVGQPAEAKR
jgi:sugar-specific transcriptional regulator TrmB